MIIYYSQFNLVYFFSKQTSFFALLKRYYLFLPLVKMTPIWQFLAPKRAFELNPSEQKTNEEK